MFSPSTAGERPTMASADFCCPIPHPFESGSHWQSSRPPRVMRATFPLMPAAYTSTVSVQVPGFENICLLTHRDRLVCDSCSSGQWFAFSFLQIPLRSGHPCRSANRSPCRAGSGLAPPGHPTTTTCVGIAPVKALRAMPGAQKRAKCWDYDISHGTEVGDKHLSTPIGGKTIDIRLRKSYEFNWVQNGDFWFLEIEGR